MQLDLGSTKKAVEAERAARQDATAAVAKLEGVISTVRQEMVEAQEASNQVRHLKLPDTSMSGGVVAGP